VYDKTKADKAVNFIKTLKHSVGQYAGKPFKLAYWQEKIIRDLFGTVNEDGKRQYRTAYIEIPRKNGKSELSAAIALLLLFADNEQGAQVFSAAGDHDQAKIVFDAAAPMVRSNLTLDKIGKVIDSVKRIIVHSTNSFYRAISAESTTKHGFNASGVIFDELHIQPNRDLWDVLTTSGGTREQPLVVAITTAGFDRNSICWEQHEYALRILDGGYKDPTFYAVVYAADEGDDWTDENVWWKANPALGDFRDIEEMRALFNKAKEVPALQNTFKRLYLNIWTSQETRWMEIIKWDESDGKVEPEELKEKRCYGGLDLSSTTDIAALVLVFPVDGNYKVISEFFIPADNIEARVRKDRVPYDVWVREGFIKATSGNVIDYKFIEDTIDNYAREFDIYEMAYDPWNATMLTQRLAENGMEMVDVRQGFASMTAPTKQLETLILQKKIHHGGNPVLRWMFDNVMVKQDANGNLKPDKEKSREKIDGIISLIMAISRAMVNEENQQGRGAILI